MIIVFYQLSFIKKLAEFNKKYNGIIFVNYPIHIFWNRLEKLGIDNPQIWLAYILCILRFVFCVIYGALNWNKGDDSISGEDKRWVEDEEDRRCSLKQKRGMMCKRLYSYDYYDGIFLCYRLFRFTVTAEQITS